MSHNGSDTLVLDFPASQRLTDVLAAAATDLRDDEVALGALLEDATRILRRDQSSPLVSLGSARSRLDSLAIDLRDRLALISRVRREVGEVDRLTGALDDWWGDPENDVRAARQRRRRELILGMVGGDASLAVRVERALVAGGGVAAALAEVDAEVRRDARIARAAAALDLDLVATEALIGRMDANLADLVVRGYGVDDAMAAVPLIERFQLDLGEVVGRARDRGTGLFDAIGSMLVARSFGVTVAELDALDGLEANFATFDNATGGRPDGQVSVADLEYVVANRCRFTPGQVIAAEMLLDMPELRIRLDTADENDDILGGGQFGRTEPGDGLIAESDLRAFVLKSQIRSALGPYADAIDIAADPSGVVDGVRSRNDLTRFIADNPDLPEPVLAAAGAMLDGGWFDESWWQEHKDELAMGAALIGSGVVLVATGGTAGTLMVVAVGSLAAAGTTVAVNLATGDDMLDDVALNAIRGGFVAAGVRTAVVGVDAYAVAATALGRSAAAAGVTGGVADVVSAGGIDLLVPEDREGTVRDVSNVIGAVAGAWETTYGGGEWLASRMTRYERLDDQLDALSTTISRQKQGRHIDGALERRDDIGGYFSDPADAQAVLDAVHDGSADILGRTRAGDILARVDDIEGVNVNRRLVDPEQATNMFVIKGTSRPSVVPTSPLATPATPTGLVR
jgi:hypothetical protein